MDKNGDSSGVKSGRARPGRTAPTSAEARERQAAALRENLQRRKAQARGQDGQPREARLLDPGPGDATG